MVDNIGSYQSGAGSEENALQTLNALNHMQLHHARMLYLIADLFQQRRITEN